MHRLHLMFAVKKQKAEHGVKTPWKKIVTQILGFLQQTASQQAFANLVVV